ncbi:Set1 complex component spp1 [Parachaetomium inaequale]|uniref:Set1 complex component spp1 n=1 Tax=Parachaetomium inaequale TaxID=2588326 RepID=A0AAN6SUE9_9PEZI|nr:Set1 complex component spp1 [Parachaetomium inaequale]
MAFSSSFFTPDVASADGEPQEPQAIKKESPSEGENQASEPRHSSPIMPHSERSQPPPGSDDMDHEMGDDGVTTSAPKTAASKKKKGTAAAVKAPPKRARPGAGAKKPKGGGSKKARSDAPTKHAGDAADGGNSSESDNGPYCLCRGPDDHRFMIACDRCEDWFHGECIGMDKHTGESLVQKYICPNCTDGGRYATRYKKMCSLAGCANPARIYDAARPSIFCSPDHCQAWWEQLIATLPRSKAASAADHLTQEEFMGLLDGPSPADNDPHSRPWHLGQPPFSTPPNFWDQPSSARALTPEEQALLTTSAAARYQLGEEIVLCKKMLQLVDLALKQREAAIAAGKGTAKDLCGYDARLDSVGATHQFALFLQTAQGEAIFKTGHLLNNTTIPNGTTNGTTPNGSNPDEPPSSAGTSIINSDPDYPHMCPKKKCKPHNGWSAILAKSVKHDMKELAAQAKEMLDAEQRVRDGAAGRFRRRIGEGNGVVSVSSEGPLGGSLGEGMEVDG